MPYIMGSSKLVIYFHGNAEDIGLSMELLIFVRDMLKVSVINFIKSSRFMFWRWSTLATEFTRATPRQIRLLLMLKTSMIT
jgi:hypothetical protein